MKPRSVSFLLSLFAAVSVGLTACGGDDPVAPAPGPSGGSAGKAGAAGAAGAAGKAGAAGAAGKAGAAGAAGGAGAAGAAGVAGAAGAPGGAAGAPGGAAGATAGSAGFGGNVTAGSSGATAGSAGKAGSTAGTGGTAAGAAGKSGASGASSGTGGTSAGTGGTGGGQGGTAAGTAGAGGDPCGATGCKEVNACDDFADQDGNGLVDCDDKPCKDTAKCVAGAKTTGLACKLATDCNANGSDPACITGIVGPDGISFDNGYCSEWCDLAAGSGCLSGANCVNAAELFRGSATSAPNAGRGLCAKKCSVTADCPELTACSNGSCIPKPDEKCVGGVDDNNDGKVDCDDPKCATTHPACTGGEKVCADFVDEDENGRTDCNDPKCKDQAVCKTTEFRVTGGPCSAPKDCDSAGNDPACIAEVTDPKAAKFTGGYCSEWCDLFVQNPGSEPPTGASAGCSGTSVCTIASRLRGGETTGLLPPPVPGFGLCAKKCANNGDCRAFYVCAADKVCVSRHVEQCTNQIDDNNDGKVDCEDALCATHPACTGGEKSCDDFFDEDEDGLTDCQDEDCKKTPVCAKGFSVSGAPCTSPSACTSQGNDPACISKLGDTVFTGGYCSEWCSVAGNQGCNEGALCALRSALLEGQLSFADGEGLCLDRCTGNGDCRALYACKSGVCFPQPVETCGNDIDDNNDGKKDCEDDACIKLESCKTPLRRSSHRDVASGRRRDRCAGGRPPHHSGRNDTTATASGSRSSGAPSAVVCSSSGAVDATRSSPVPAMTKVASASTTKR